MAQPRQATDLGQELAVYIHLKKMGQSFEDRQICVLARENHCFERGVKEAIHVKLEKLTLSRGGGLTHNPPTMQSYTASANNPNVCTFTQDLVTHQSCDPGDKGEVPTNETRPTTLLTTLS